MVFDNPFVCCSGGCLRKAWSDDDLGDFLCFMCDQKECNRRAVHSLNTLLSKNPTPTPDGTPTFHDIFAQESLGVKLLESVFGDGWEAQCPCRLCKRGWLNAGWVCPAMYYFTEYRCILDARRKAGTGDWHTRCSEAYHWVELLLAIHFELYPPPDDDRVDTAGSAQPPPAAHSRRQSRSRSRSGRSNPSSVVQPAHIV